MGNTEMGCRLYAITPPDFRVSEFVPRVERALMAGDVGCLQLRLKEAPDAKIREAAQALLPVCHAHDTAFIMNDSVDIAIEVGADGVHLGQEDLVSEGVAAIRARLPEDMILGVTCHASSHLAMEAGEKGADYVAFGAFYPTTSKPKEKLEKWGIPTLELLQNWAFVSTVPCVAIGGVTPDNCVPLVRAGADFIAAITGIWDHPQGEAAGVMAYRQAIAQGLAQS